MRIGISTRGLNQGSFAISTIIYHLVEAILELSPHTVEIILYFNDPEYEIFFDPSFPKRSIKLGNRFIWDHFWLPSALKRDDVDIALFMKGTMSFFLPCKGAVLFHDMGYFHDGLRPYKPLETVYQKIMIPNAARRAAKIYTISEYTKNEIHRIFRVDPGKMSVIYPDCSTLFEPVAEPQILKDIAERYNLPQDFIFIPVSISPRKNLGRILDAFSRLHHRIPHHMVITGGQSWRSRRLIRRIQSEFPLRIHMLGNVPQEHMPALFSLAKFTVYPSLLEGFGMPILESFRCGCPVLTSNLASMPEVAGEAAYLVDPTSVDDIASGMLRLATDEDLRQNLKLLGIERARRFSWQAAARTILDELLQFS